MREPVGGHLHEPFGPVPVVEHPARDHRVVHARWRRLQRPHRRVALRLPGVAPVAPEAPPPRAVGRAHGEPVVVEPRVRGLEDRLGRALGLVGEGAAAHPERPRAREQPRALRGRHGGAHGLRGRHHARRHGSGRRRHARSDQRAVIGSARSFHGAAGRVFEALVVEVELRRGLGAELVERPGRHHRRRRRRWRGERSEGAVEAAEHRVDPGGRRTKRPLQGGLRAPEAQRRERRQAGVEEHVRGGQLEPCVAPVLARALRDEGLADPRRGARVVADAERVHGPPARGVDRVGELEVGEGPVAAHRDQHAPRRVGGADELRAPGLRGLRARPFEGSREVVALAVEGVEARVEVGREGTEHGVRGEGLARPRHHRARMVGRPARAVPGVEPRVGDGVAASLGDARVPVDPTNLPLDLAHGLQRSAEGRARRGHDQRRADEHQRAPRRVRGEAHPERSRRREDREPVEHQRDLSLGGRRPGYDPSGDAGPPREHLDVGDAALTWDRHGSLLPRGEHRAARKVAWCDRGGQRALWCRGRRSGGAIEK